MTNLLRWTLLALALGACRTPADMAAGSQTLDDTGNGPTGERILLVASGGWQSCEGESSPFEQRIHDSFDNLVKNLEAKATVDYVIACLGSVSPGFPFSSLWYAPKDGVVRSIWASDFAATVKAHVAQTTPTQVYLIGHSYGGWVALRLAEAGVKAAAVFALDPIDARDCLPTDNLFLEAGIHSPSCVRSPNFDYAKIAGNTQKVFHLWQKLGPIHSTPISHAVVVNHEMDIDHPSFNGSQADKVTYAHRMIGSDPTAWGIVCQTIFKSNGWQPSGCRAIETDGGGHFTAYVEISAPALGTVAP